MAHADSGNGGDSTFTNKGGTLNENQALWKIYGGL